MDEVKYISSIQNPLVKKVSLLKEKKSGRRKSGLFVVEGQQEIRMALEGDYHIETLFFYTQIISEDAIMHFMEGVSCVPEIIKVSKEVYQRIAYRKKTEGILAIARTKSHALDLLEFKRKKPLVLVAEAPEKPGNIGALLRTADAADLDAVIIANPKGDLYNPNIIRSSVGCIFTTNIAVGSTSEIIAFLNERNIAMYCAALSASENYTKVDFTYACAIVVGTESTGLTSDWLKNATQNIIIPMQGKIDSMNVSVSAAILIFEAKRQREFK